MRITDSLKYDMLSQNVSDSLSNLNGVQQQISTGKKLTTFSDDPAGASQSLALRSALADNAQYQRDAGQATSFLKATDGALSDASAILQSARQIAVQGANSDQSPDSLAALSSQVDGLTQQLTQVANSDLHGKYLFGGTNTTTPPYDASQNYTGNGGAVTATIGPNYAVQLNTPGSAAFGPAFAALKTLKADLTAGNVSAISTDIAGVDAGLSAVSTAQAATGAKTNQVDAVTQRLTRSQNDLTDAVSGIEDVNLATAYVQLQSAQNVYQASLATTAKAFQYSLSDYLH